MGKHQLPKLSYEYDALEPYIDSKTMELHHSKHHQSYIDGLNNAKEKLSLARKSGDFSLVKHYKKEIAFHGSGHMLHSIFWTNMGPSQEVKEKPEGELYDKIVEKYGDFETFWLEFKSTATTIEGSGWAILVVIEGELEILSLEKHQNLFEMGAIPILVLDMWEHAFYLSYQNRKAEYLDAVYNVINWDDVEKRYLSAKNNSVLNFD